MWAIISDIHANLEALQAVAEDIQQHNVEKVICLGDIVNYGPNPCECVDIVMEFDVTVMGNHDHSVVFDPEKYYSRNHRSIRWTQSQLKNVEGQTRPLRWNFLSSLELTHTESGFLFVHGSPRDPLKEWIFPEDIYNPRKLEKNYQLVDKHCFHGHTHVPGIFTEEPQYFSITDEANKYRLDVEKTLVNVGSVGQPRDGDPRACYVLLDEDLVVFRRIKYDVEKTREKIYRIPELDYYLGDRLLEGR